MPNNKRTIEGPARLVQDNIDETGLNYSRGVIPRRTTLEADYGEEGTGWEVVHPAAETPKDKENRRLGRSIINIVVTPDGDQHYHDKWK